MLTVDDVLPGVPDIVREVKVEAVFDELAESRPAGLRYASYRLADGVSFVPSLDFRCKLEGRPVSRSPLDHPRPR